MGWARANILFDRYGGIPDVGSPMEILFLVLWRMRQQIEFHKSRVVVQALLNQQGAEPEHIEHAYEDLRKAFFPFEVSQKSEEVAALKKVMAKELARGPLSVRPLVDLTREAMRQKLSRGNAALVERANMLRTGRLQRIDRGDPMHAARIRKRPAS